MKSLKFLDFFAGIGGFRRGLEMAGHKCVGFCEFDKYATASYVSMHCITDEQREYLSTLNFRKRQKEILKDEYRNGEWFAKDIKDVHADDLPDGVNCYAFGAPCLVAGTLITTNKGMVPIEDIKIGDMVLTHNQRFRKVEQTMQHEHKGIYTLQIYGNPDTRITGNHRVYVRDKENSSKKYSEPYWKSVENFSGNEMLEFPAFKELDYSSTLKNDQSEDASAYIDGVLWVPLKNISYSPDEIRTVYNLEVEEDHSYTGNNIGLHNCMDFSLAGLRAGLDGEKSVLVREIFRILDEQQEKDRPEWLIYENVKGMLSSNGGLDFLSILSEMDRLGYDCEWQNINSSWYVPQNRERIFTIGHLRRYGSAKIFPIKGTNGENSIHQIMQYDSSRDNSQCDRVYSTDGVAPTLSTMSGGGREPHIAEPCFCDINYGAGMVITDEARCLQSRYYKGVCGRPAETSGIVIPFQEQKQQNGEETNEDEKHKSIYVQLKNGETVCAIWYEKCQCYITIRKLTPKECFRLQGWDDEYFEKAEFVNSDSQLYKQAGNGVTVNVVYEIGKKLNDPYVKNGDEVSA